MIDIDSIFKENKINANRFYPITRLHEIMTDLGLTRMQRSSFTTDFINRKINTGELIMPPKAPFDRWRLTGEQMKEIVLAFMPGGDGFWSYLGKTEPLKNEERIRGAEEVIQGEELSSQTQELHESLGQRDDSSSPQAIQE